MTRREVALSFVRYFCEGRISDLGGLLTDDLEFQGPFPYASTRENYLAALHADPPAPAQFEVRRIFEEGEDVCMIYEYRKEGTPLLIAQWTRFRGMKIRGITLLFDGREGG
jgi:hypothetical protein